MKTLFELMKDSENMEPEELLIKFKELISSKRIEIEREYISQFLFKSFANYTGEFTTVVLQSIIVNLAINEDFCPYCFIESLQETIDANFTKDEDEKSHNHKFKHAEELSDMMKEGSTEH